MARYKKKIGEVTREAGTNVWPHEYRMASILAEHGYRLRFKCASEREGEHTADLYIDGILWEMKAPRGGLKSIERNLKRGRWQCDKIVFASFRMKGIPDKAIERELHVRAKNFTGINAVRFINRQKKIIDIK